MFFFLVFYFSIPNFYFIFSPNISSPFCFSYPLSSAFSPSALHFPSSLCLFSSSFLFLFSSHIYFTLSPTPSAPFASFVFILFLLHFLLILLPFFLSSFMFVFSLFYFTFPRLPSAFSPPPPFSSLLYFLLPWKFFDFFFIFSLFFFHFYQIWKWVIFFLF